MTGLVNRVKVFSSSTGPGDLTAGAAISTKYMTPAEAGAVDARSYVWLIEQGNDFEIVRANWTASGSVIARSSGTVLWSKISGTVSNSAKITTNGTQTISLVAAAEDYILSQPPVAKSAGFNITKNDRDALFLCTNTITVTLDAVATLGNLFKVRILNVGSGVITIDPNGSEQLDGATTATLNPGEGALIEGDGTALYSNGNRGAARYDRAQSLTTPQQGVALKNIGAVGVALLGGKIVESHASNAVTFAVKGLDGNDPSATNPVGVNMGDGNVRWLTAATSVTIPSGGQMGTANGVPFRVWLTMHDNAGALQLGASQRVHVTYILFGLDSRGITSTQASSGATTGGAAVTYTTSAIVTDKPYVIVGFADYESGLTTAGTWNAAPTRITMYRAGMPKPGDYLSRFVGTFSSSTSTTGTSFVTGGLSVATLIESPCNLIKIEACGVFRNSTAGADRVYAQLARNSNSNMIGAAVDLLGSSGVLILPCTIITYDKPAAGAGTTVNYIVMIKTLTGASTAVWGDSALSEIWTTEIMS